MFDVFWDKVRIVYQLIKVLLNDNSMSLYLFPCVLCNLLIFFFFIFLEMGTLTEPLEFSLHQFR